MNHDAASRAAVLKKFVVPNPLTVDGSAGGAETSCVIAQIVINSSKLWAWRRWEMLGSARLGKLLQSKLPDPKAACNIPKAHHDRIFGVNNTL